VLPGDKPIAAIKRVMRCRRCNTKGDNAKGDVEIVPRAASGYVVREELAHRLI
jgi:hypothetical protein